MEPKVKVKPPRPARRLKLSGAYVSDEQYAALEKLAAEKGYPSVEDLCAAIFEAALQEAKS